MIGRRDMTPSKNLHELSRKYWTCAATSYLGTAAYYDAQEVALRKVLVRHGPFASVVDLGCADGRFTMVAAEHADYALGVDINPALIQYARERVSAAHCVRIGFRVEALDEQPDLGTYALVMCLGVTSCLIAPEAFINVVNLVRGCALPGQLVLLKDTLSRGEPIMKQSGQYVAMYRNRDAYLAAWAAAGLHLEQELPLSETEVSSNALMVFRVDQSKP